MKTEQQITPRNILLHFHTSLLGHFLFLGCIIPGHMLRRARNKYIFSYVSRELVAEILEPSACQQKRSEAGGQESAQSSLLISRSQEPLDPKDPPEP